MPSLQANTRKIIGSAVKKLKRESIIPAVVYGRGFPSENIEVEGTNFKKIFEQAGASTIVDLLVDGKSTFKVLIHEIQYDPISDEVVHIDFYRIHEKEKVKVNVKIKFLGEAPVIKEKNGILVHNLSEVEIQALPKDLIHEVSVDLTQLKEFSDLIHVRDIKVPSTVEITQNPEEVVVSVSMPRKEEEEVAPVLAEGEVAPTGEAGDQEKKEEGATPAASKADKNKEEK